VLNVELDPAIILEDHPVQLKSLWEFIRKEDSE